MATDWLAGRPTWRVVHVINGSELIRIHLLAFVCRVMQRAVDSDVTGA